MTEQAERRTMWVNGELRTPGDAVVSARDHGFVVGDGAFEACKIVAGQVFALRRHLDRIERTIHGLGLPPLPRATVEAGIAELLAENRDLLRGNYDLLRITYTGGPGPLGSPRGNGPATIALGLTTPGSPPAAQTGVVVVPWPRNERGALSGLKTTSYAENVLALAYAIERGASEAIFGNTVGNLAEGTGSNIFIVRAGELLTPPLSAGILDGVSRRLVLQWYGGAETDIPLADLYRADEVFLTSTGRDVQPVVTVDDTAIGEGRPGPITAAVAAKFAANQTLSMEP